MTVYDSSFKGHTIEIKKGIEKFFIYLDGSLYGTSNALYEAEEEIDKYIKEHKLKHLFEIL